ncbi:hypothetical protein SY83_13650 [Paenibacillus swuensis]|uniref:Uncharacterized protein n=1 Tax=Paenibacillus swuensis TaxID=1178515 RepID=A0A172TK30_9BACL|nr:hypothetical protein [Paenibacillus swuensis]ANE47133.1 hypothetical protein SY83_13650 [Paenibacillus swuensis]
MEKKHYYIAVGAGTVMEDQGAAAFELEIEATEEEADQLQELFRTQYEDEIPMVTDTFILHPLKATQDHTIYKDHLQDVYALIHKLGTPETKKHIESMQILDKIK